MTLVRMAEMHFTLLFYPWLRYGIGLFSSHRSGDHCCLTLQAGCDWMLNQLDLEQHGLMSYAHGLEHVSAVYVQLELHLSHLT